MKKLLFLWVILAVGFMSYRPKTVEPSVSDPSLCQAGTPLLAINATAFVAQAGPVFVRKNATTLTAAEVTAYRAGVAAMKALPASNPRSWQYQSDMHGKMAGAILAGQDQCQHGSYLFLSWHRMYLHFFERILRASSGNPNFGLPYWGYNTASAVSRRVPPIYRSPAAGNSLFDGTRDPALNNNASPASISAANASTTNAFSFTNFTSAPGSGLSFGGQRVPGALHFGSPHGALENTPHDVIHVSIGGNMLDPRTAALDPIFWAHHCQIDRLWDRWLNTGGGRANPTEANWLNRSFTFFTETGAAVTMTGSQVVATARQLNYRYDDTPPAVAMIEQNEALQTQTASFFDLSWLIDDQQQKPKPVVEKPVTSRVVAELGAKDVATPRTKLALADKSGGIAHCMAEMKRNKYLKTGEIPTRVALYVDGLMYEKLPQGTYEVYVNMPDATNPSYENEYYVGNLGLFGLSKELTKGKGGAVALEITNVMMKLYDKNPNVKTLDVTLYQRGLEGANGKPLAVSGKIKLGKVRIVTEKQ